MGIIQIAIAMLACQQFTVNVVQPEPTFDVRVVASEPVAETTSEKPFRYLVKFTSETCGPCKSWDKTERPKLEKQGVWISVVDCTHGNKWGVSRVPEFWVVNTDSRKVHEKFHGHTSADVLLESIGEPVSTCTPLVNSVQTSAVSSIYNGKAGSSHESRVSLIDHLFTEGIHAGRHTMSDLNKLSDNELNALHERDHGWATTTQARPTNRSVRRRRGGLFGLFR